MVSKYVIYLEKVDSNFNLADMGTNYFAMSKV